MDFLYKEHFSQTKIFINSFPVPAVTKISVVTEGSQRKAYALKAEPSTDVVPVSKFYKIEITRTPVPDDSFSMPDGIFSLGIMDETGHTVYRNCSVSEIRQAKENGSFSSITIESGQRLEFKDYRYFGGDKCLTV